MNDNGPTEPGPQILWLEPYPPENIDIGRQWCVDNVWGDNAVKYVRADLVVDLDEDDFQLTAGLAL